MTTTASSTDPSTTGFVDEQWVTFEPEVPGHSPGVGVIGVSLECVTDGAVGPTRHLFPTVSFSGHATEVVAVDPRPLLSVVQASGNEGDIDEQTGVADMNTLKFLFQLDLPATQDVTINYNTQTDPAPPDDHAQATAGPDYTAVPMGSPLQEIIRRDELSATVEIAITGDDLYELDETMQLVWEFVPSDPCAANVPSLDDSVIRLSTDSQMHPHDHPEPALRCRPVIPDYWKVVSVGTIENDDSAPRMSVTGPPPAFSVQGPTATEGPPPPLVQMAFWVSLNAPTAVPVTFDYRTVNGTGLDAAMSGDDYTRLDSTSATIPANPDPMERPGIEIPVVILDDFIAEDDEHFFLEITDVDSHATAPPLLRGTGTITDDEPTIRIEGNPAQGLEGTELEFDVTATNVSGQVTVDYDVTEGTATSGGVDYSVATPGRLTFTSHGTQTITVNTVGDDIDEADEDFTVTLSLPPGSNNARILGDASITGVIQDDTDTPELHFARTVEVSEGQTVNLDFALSPNSSSNAVEVGFSHGPTADTTDIEATPGGTNPDYSVNIESPTPPPNTLTISAGVTASVEIEPLTLGPASINIGANQDPYFEEDEFFELKVTHARQRCPARPLNVPPTGHCHHQECQPTPIQRCRPLGRQRRREVDLYDQPRPCNPHGFGLGHRQLHVECPDLRRRHRTR